MIKIKFFLKSCPPLPNGGGVKT